MSGTDAFSRLPEEKRERIIRAAVREFSEHGYQNASMNSVVREAGISKGSLFHYFRTKFDLFDSIVEQAMGLAKERLRVTRDDTRTLSLSRRLEQVIRAGFSFIDDHPYLARIYFRVLRSGKAPFGAERIRNLHLQSIKYLHTLLEDTAARNELNPELDTMKAAFLIHGMMHHLLHAYYTEHSDLGLGLYHGSGEEIESWIRTATDLLTNGMIRQ